MTPTTVCATPGLVPLCDTVVHPCRGISTLTIFTCVYAACVLIAADAGCSDTAPVDAGAQGPSE
jgi:hypothetical protein